MNPSDNNKKIQYEVPGNKIEVADIPCWYSHTIKNIGDDDLVTIMWVNEVFDENNTDTYKIM